MRLSGSDSLDQSRQKHAFIGNDKIRRTGLSRVTGLYVGNDSVCNRESCGTWFGAVSKDGLAGDDPRNRGRGAAFRYSRHFAERLRLLDFRLATR